MEELIIHPRIQTDFYKNTPNLEMFEYAVKNSKNPLCYNGDICTKEEYEIICNRFQEVPSVMIGRGSTVEYTFSSLMVEKSSKVLIHSVGLAYWV